MKQFVRLALLLLAPSMAQAETADPLVRRVVQDHVLPRMDTFANNAKSLADAARDDCDPNTSPSLLYLYGSAFDGWIAVSHLRFGPAEKDNRAYALAFWPDPRGKTPRALSKLMADRDPIAETAETYRDVSIAARGFYALEFLLYDPSFAEKDKDYTCLLIKTISADIAHNAQDIRDDWRSIYGQMVSTRSEDRGLYNNEDMLRSLFNALSTGLQFDSETRLGRPLGTFDRPRPGRAEARRSGRSVRHLDISLASLHDLALTMSNKDTELMEGVSTAFQQAYDQIDALDDPVFASVAEPAARLKVEIIQQSVNNIRDIVRGRLGPKLGVAAGFNAMDGD
ncbi:imelysin family protein [Halovulum sp. GXIMD14793]